MLHGWTFATAEECEYPDELCAIVAQTISKILNADPTPQPPKRNKQKSKPSLETLIQYLF